MIELINVKKIYGKGKNELMVLDDINLKIDMGEYASIVGPSGSGKTTLMNILGFIDVPSYGEYFFEGRLTSSLKDNELSKIRNRKIGFIFQSFNLISELTALENIELPMIYANISPAKRIKKAKELLEVVGLSNRMNHKPPELSGGQQQRVAIARALALDPPLLLADEPTGNLDSKSGNEIIDLLEKLNRDGKTIIVITHDRQIASRTRRRIEILDGKIVKDESAGG